MSKYLESKYRWYLKDPNIKFSNRLPPQPTLQDTCEELTGCHVVGIWLRQLPGGDWCTVVAWSNPGGSRWRNPEYGLLRDDGKLYVDPDSDWVHHLIHGFFRYKRYSLGTDWRAIYGTAGK